MYNKLIKKTTEAIENPRKVLKYSININKKWFDLLCQRDLGDIKKVN